MGQVAFWSPVEGQLGNTAHTAAVASLLGLEYDIRTLASQAHFRSDDLEQKFLSKRNKKLGSMYEFSDSGIDALERLVRTKRMKPESVKDNAVVVEPERLDLLIGTTKPDELLYGHLRDVIQPMFEAAKQYYSAILTDLPGGPSNLLSLELLSHADLVVVTLSQNLSVLERYFAGEGVPQALQGKPHLLVLGQYDPDSKYTAANIRRHFQLKRPLYTIPYCTGFRDALNDKDVLGWFRRHRGLGRTHASAPFMRSVRELSRQILLEIGINPDLKAIERGVS